VSGEASKPESKLETETIGDRIILIPPKGILEQSKSIILNKLNGGEKRWVKGIEIPCTPALRLVEVVVDDACEVCPMAIEFVSELVAVCPHVTVKLYNISYIDSPFPVKETPTFRVNESYIFEGMPISEMYNKILEDHLREAYIRTHPQVNELLNRIQAFAKANNLYRTPNITAFKRLLYKLLMNIDKYGYPYCPCRPLKIPKPNASKEEIYELNKDKVCPCVYALTDIKMRGHCLCGLFWTKEAVDKYIEERKKKYGAIFARLEELEKVFTYKELAVRILTGESKRYLEAWIKALEEIYPFLPED
jgi:ferredoxin-thioredoxin reductase catalytic subunit